MDCTAKIDALAAAVDAWTATTQQSQAIKAQRDMLDMAAMQAMYQAYWELSLCQFGGALVPPAPMPMPLMESQSNVYVQQSRTSDSHAMSVPVVTTLPVFDMVKFLGDVATIQRNRA